ncbi:MAG: HAD family hydrolase [Deltaproteobacteria bacterium]|nr:HAD family hydrolase [Deltaproteobacteria bacterium]
MLQVVNEECPDVNYSGSNDKNVMQKLFLFDFDGVLVDSLNVYERRVKLCLERIGKPVVNTRADFLELFEDNFYEAIVKKGIDLAEFMNASKSIPTQDDYDQMGVFTPLLPVLSELQKNNILAVISSNVSRVIHVVLSRHGFDGCFKEVLGADFGYSKRDKIFRAMNGFHVERENTYYVGDTTGDIREARMAGVRTVAVTWGWHSRERLETVSPDYLIETPEGLLSI